jgi:hypothetical protein
MADETVATFADLLRDAKGPLVEALQWSTPLFSELMRDTSPEIYDGEKFRMGVILAPQQGTGMITETGTLNTPQTLEKTKTRIDVGIVTIPISFSVKLMKVTDSKENAWADAVEDRMRMAEDAFKRVINEQWCAAGDALLAAFTAGATSATQTVGIVANFYELYEGRIVDLKIRASGNDIASTNGANRKIVSVDPDVGTVTFDVSVQITTSDGIYIQGSYGNALAGFGNATATTGTFQEINRTTFPQWKGTDVSPAAVSDPTLAIMDKAERVGARRSGVTPDFYIGDPAVIDKFQQGLTVQARWAGDDGVLESGWEGVKYRSKVLVREFDAPSRTLYGVTKEDVRILALDSGPDWDEEDGSFFKRFNRSLVLEAWLVWFLQLAFKRCNSQVKIGNLTQAG